MDITLEDLKNVANTVGINIVNVLPNGDMLQFDPEIDDTRYWDPLYEDDHAFDLQIRAEVVLRYSKDYIIAYTDKYGFTTTPINIKRNIGDSTKAVARYAIIVAILVRIDEKWNKHMSSSHPKV